jgi:hypothetical protein
MDHAECRQQLKDQKDRISISIKAVTTSKTIALKDHKPWFTVDIFHKAEPGKIISSTQWQRCCAYAAKAEALRDFEENHNQQTLKRIN